MNKIKLLQTKKNHEDTFVEISFSRSFRLLNTASLSKMLKSTEFDALSNAVKCQNYIGKCGIIIVLIAFRASRKA